MKNVIMIAMLSASSLCFGMYRVPQQYATRAIRPYINKLTSRFYTQPLSRAEQNKLAQLVTEEESVNTAWSNLSNQRYNTEKYIQKLTKRIEAPPFYTQLFPARLNAYLDNLNQKNYKIALKNSAL